MTPNTLTSPKGAIPLVAALFRKTQICKIFVQEERAFTESKFLSLGEINLFPDQETHEHSDDDFTRAVRHGAFEWTIPDESAVKAELLACLGFSGNSEKAQKAEGKVRRIVDMVASAAVRLGLNHPIFDPRSLEGMPFRRPTTVITDTTGVLQGALSFVARFLHPSARIKVPAVVQMEIVNFADRFMNNRRAPNVKQVDLLADHLKSQAGQRVLLQLELHSDVELERTFLLGDPLRGAFQREEDKELKELNLSVAIRSYADRLILESARQHQSQVSHGHPVMLLTSDQGLARMALAEGLAPLYFRSVKAGAFFGKRLTGANFNPFTGGLYTCSIPQIIWELATIFGTAKLETSDGMASILVHAIGEKLAWAPYHSHDDLLWVDASENLFEVPPSPSVTQQTADVRNTGKSTGDKTNKKPKTSIKQNEVTKKPTSKLKDSIGLYKFSVDRLLSLIDTLENEQELPSATIMRIIGVNTESAVDEYRRFLESGAAVKITQTAWTTTPILKQVSIALRNVDLVRLREALSSFPSYSGLINLLRDHPKREPLLPTSFGRANSTYFALAEVSGIGINIYGRGFYATVNEPTNDAFALTAISAYDRLEEGNGWVATGRWLEELATSEGIHPLIARSRLQTASELGLLKRVTEGSTTDTKFERHTVRVLGHENGVPVIKIEHLYRGDFLIPGKASSSLKIEKSNP